jgi:hypothetical protein
MDPIILVLYTISAMVILMSESIVARYLKSAMPNMIKNNDLEIMCPCRRCELGTLLNLSSRKLYENLLVGCFMDGYTHEDDYEDTSKNQ